MQEVTHCLKRVPTANVIEIPSDGVITKANFTISYSPHGIPHVMDMKIVAQRPSQQ